MLRILFTLAVLWTWGLTAEPVEAAAEPVEPVEAAAEGPIVVWISMDGVRHDALGAESLPAFTRIAREGASAGALVPVFPSSTFANHVAQATGTHADRHGIVGNRFLDPELGYFDYGNDARFLEAEPIWAAAERQGVRAATFFWVGSETDWRGVGASFRRAPFEGGLPERVKVDQVLTWLDLPEKDRPRLIMSWWHGADRAGHRNGPGTPEVAAQLREQDGELLRLLEGIDTRDLWARTTLIVSSDHGMIAADRVLDGGSLLRRAGLSGRVIHGTSVAHVHLRDPSQVDEALAAFEGVEGLTAWRAEELPPALRYRHPTRVGQIVLLAEPPLRLGGARRRGQAFLQGLFGKASGGAHGYDPARYTEMHAILLAMGRGVASGARLGQARAIDLAATVAALLEIDPPASSEGEIIPGLGAPLSEPRAATTAP
ncbi:MAG: alkaline phosphatase family protein [bacterium]|nr:alkaline phosphatase family protein [bacterium]MCP5065680.1 alkaline phosphatase family protein [bacterium]